MQHKAGAVDQIRYYRTDRRLKHLRSISAFFEVHACGTRSTSRSDAALWLLGSMMLDYLTPKELTAYMIAAATAPAVIGTGLAII